jgi:hypothetical protein
MDNFCFKMKSHGILCEHAKGDSYFCSVSRFIMKHCYPLPSFEKKEKKRKREEENNSSNSDSSMECLFFKACRAPIRESALENFTRHDSEISKIILNNGRLEAYILPKNILMWPTFFASKQKSELCKEIYFKRIADSNLPRFDETVRLLLNRKDVISTGLSGTGKSTEVNGLLMEFLAHLGEEDWPKEVWYRYDEVMIKFSLESGNPCVKKVDAGTLLKVLRLTRPYNTVTN